MAHFFGDIPIEVIWRLPQRHAAWYLPPAIEAVRIPDTLPSDGQLEVSPVPGRTQSGRTFEPGYVNVSFHWPVKLGERVAFATDEWTKAAIPANQPDVTGFLARFSPPLHHMSFLRGSVDFAPEPSGSAGPQSPALAEPVIARGSGMSFPKS